MLKRARWSVLFPLVACQAAPPTTPPTQSITEIPSAGTQFDGEYGGPWTQVRNVTGTCPGSNPAGRVAIKDGRLDFSWRKQPKSRQS